MQYFFRYNTNVGTIGLRTAILVSTVRVLHATHINSVVLCNSAIPDAVLDVHVVSVKKSTTDGRFFFLSGLNFVMMRHYY
jgi:hypothetical protein